MQSRKSTANVRNFQQHAYDAGLWPNDTSPAVLRRKINVNFLMLIFNVPTRKKYYHRFVLFQKMKTEDKSSLPKVRIAVIGKSNVGKSGKFQYL